MTFQPSLVALTAALFAGTLHAQEAKPADTTPKVASQFYDASFFYHKAYSNNF